MFIAAFLDNFWAHLNGGINGWTLFGLLGNGLFTSRFVVQWYVSEKRKQSVIPQNFWRLSFLGGVINLIYALHVGAVPFILGSLLPPVIAARNLMLISRGERNPPPGTPLPDNATPAIPVAALPAAAGAGPTHERVHVPEREELTTGASS